MKYEEIAKVLEGKRVRSWWDKGVLVYAFELLDGYNERKSYDGREAKDLTEAKEWMLNGAFGWCEYSWAGCSLCYNYQIAERLCTPSELAKKRYGSKKPNRAEEWLDVQARALGQAFSLIQSVAKEVG